MKLLLLGSGGREHALAWKIAQSPKIEKLYIAPGNAGTAGVGENVPLKADDFDGIKAFVLQHAIDMVVVGPEDPLVKGVYYYFKQDQIKDMNDSQQVEFMKKLPKFKAVNLYDIVYDSDPLVNDVIFRKNAFALVYWGDAIPKVGTKGS